MRALLALCAAVAALLPSTASAQRIADIGAFASMRSNALVGYGIVVGLPGTGDDNLDYATVAMRGTASRLGMALPAGINPALKNAAAVIVTAEIAPFAKPGQRIDVTVSALGKAKSLRGGTLILTPLQGADGGVYALAQGSVTVGGLGVEAADGSKLSVNVPSSGRIAGGATVERPVPNAVTPNAVAATGADARLRFHLHTPDPATAVGVARAINADVGPGTAEAIDAVSIAITAPATPAETVALMGRIGALSVTPASAPARVIVNPRTGTVVITDAVRIAPAAVAHGKLTVRIDEAPRVIQPAPLGNGRTAVEPSSSISVRDDGGPIAVLRDAATLRAVVASLNSLGASPGDLVAILEALRAGGALKAELVIL